MKSPLASLSLGALFTLPSAFAGLNNVGEQEPLRPPIDPLKYKAACPDYKNYAMRPQYVNPIYKRRHTLIHAKAHRIAQVPWNYPSNGHPSTAEPSNRLSSRRSSMT